MRLTPLSLALLLLLAARPAAATTRACADANQVTIPGLRITEARAITPADSLRARGQRAHCRVSGTIDGTIGIVALLPDDWNGRFLMGGGGGFVGILENQLATSVHQGYATVGTDAGHRDHPLSARWVLNNRQALEDFAHRAVHRTAETTKQLIAAFYGRAPQHSYFVGCSNGGRQALIEAQRYPEDFDGIVAIAPALDFVNITTTFVRNLQAQYPAGSAAPPVLTREVATLLASRVMAACDSLDGVRDGSLENPATCRFRIESLPACANDVAGAECVTNAQRAALRTILSPVAIGAALRYPAIPPGNEGDEGGWQDWLIGPLPPVQQISSAPSVQGAFGTQFMRYFVYGDSTWSHRGFDLARVERDAAPVRALLAADNPDLRRFQARGGKLIIAHGWSDPALYAGATIDYVRAVQQRTPNAASMTRLFLMPGVLHCVGGSGCDTVDWAAAISAWVEQQQAPSQLPASKLAGGRVVRTRPLCAYPATARYNGRGSTDDAASFTCR